LMMANVRSMDYSDLICISHLFDSIPRQEMSSFGTSFPRSCALHA
jgi:hypothetical protein